MSAVLVAVLVIVIPVAVVIAAIGALRRRDDAVKADASHPAVETLRYHVPEGQDAAAVMAALETEGYPATLSPAPAIHEVLIPCHSGADRERAHVRSVIAHAAVDMEGQPGERPVVFADEPGGAGAV
jgi:hypothetical protein